jgi:hypothetical protein
MRAVIESLFSIEAVIDVEAEIFSLMEAYIDLSTLNYTKLLFIEHRKSILLSFINQVELERLIYVIVSRGKTTNRL